ncbi:aldo/keto reductase [Haloarcula sp. CBA1130]|uniref:aldo/keto reductase n=1 Tax=unclassified Haloarcula TaxID=2624677 RepID=UPI0012462588|nr:MULTISPECIES: aldo/keto reductase [unclassified Haloarcula]KAA9396232.1 aldo/keto reductase [Haloarcula sp. CBA1129]KAA9396384.1 aldo/keto reductase [Haloarcula sp. CBA1130]KAA9397552.1 aldo/keto reductase [Haloarcula sp. CBA1129]
MPREYLPRLGLGTYSDEKRDQWRENVHTALDVGFRHIDTAQVYENEQYVGEGIRESSVARDDIWLSTKTVHHDVPLNAEQVPAAIDGCLDRLGVDFVDLLYVHWPSGIYDHESVLPAYDEAYKAGKTRNVGLSNFSPDLLNEAMDVLDAPLYAHQAEMHPLLPQRDLVAHAQEHDYTFVAYSPLAKGAVFDVPEICEVAEKHECTPAQVSLAWILSHENVAAIPKASSREHMTQNLATLDLALDEEDIELIDSIERRHREVDADHGPWNW